MRKKTVTSSLPLASPKAASSGADSRNVYREPPRENIRIVDALPVPLAFPCPDKSKILFVQSAPLPQIELLAEPIAQLAGTRISARTHSVQRRSQNVRMWVYDLSGNRNTEICALPLAFYHPVWSPDSRKIAFQVKVRTCVELWVADAAAGTSKRLGDARLNNILTDGEGYSWLADSRTLFAMLVPDNHKKPPNPPEHPEGPIIKEAAGKTSQLRTFQDLISSSTDEATFAYFATSQLSFINTDTGEVTKAAKPDLYEWACVSPDGCHILVKRLRRPFSCRVPYAWFAASFEVLSRNGVLEETIAVRDTQDEVPRQGVVTGPRLLQWQPYHAATLVWAEAQDGGDPTRKSDFRESVYRWDANASTPPQMVARLAERLIKIEWLSARDEAIFREYDREKRWRTVSHTTLTTDGDAHRTTLFSLNRNDDYANPGDFVTEILPSGQTVILMEDDAVYLAGEGASPEGTRPFLDRFNIRTKEKARVFLAAAGHHESFCAFTDPGKRRILIWSESPQMPRNLFALDLDDRKRTRITDVQPPSQELSRVRKEILRYKRADGVELSGTLYLPPDYDGRGKLPAIMWAYPREYSTSAEAGQIRGSSVTYTWPSPLSPLHFALHGYAVLDEVAMPVIGPPETANDTFVAQISSSARAAIDAMDARGIIDRQRVVVGGHSYGAFMTANLLAQTDFFAAGIARSGAYNRTLTPFGFQGERRSYWEAPAIYSNLSPFAAADKIKSPLLLIHGQVDSNSGTFPEQSERLFQAISGQGGTVRLVILPLEDHSYRARESVLHTLAEMIAWADRFAGRVRVEL